MRSKTQLLALNGVIAAAYAALTLVASAMNLAYGRCSSGFRKL